MDALPLTRHDWHSDWNYTLRPEAYDQAAGAPHAFGQPSPDLAWLCHPALTGLPAQERDALIDALMTLHDRQREAGLDKRRGHRPRLIAPGVGRRPVLTLADRLLATILHQRLSLPQVAIAALFSVRPETISKRIRDIRQLLDQAGHAIQPGPHRLASLDDHWFEPSCAHQGRAAKTVPHLRKRGGAPSFALRLATAVHGWRRLVAPNTRPSRSASSAPLSSAALGRVA